MRTDTLTTPPLIRRAAKTLAALLTADGCPVSPQTYTPADLQQRAPEAIHAWLQMLRHEQDRFHAALRLLMFQRLTSSLLSARRHTRWTLRNARTEANTACIQLRKWLAVAE